MCTAGTCKDVNCAPADIASCDITGLKPSTAYTVVVVAQKTGLPDSLVGGPDTFTTDAPAPLVGSLTTCKTDADCQKTTGELCDATQKKCYCPSPRGEECDAHAAAESVRHRMHLSMCTRLAGGMMRRLGRLLPAGIQANAWATSCRRAGRHQ